MERNSMKWTLRKGDAADGVLLVLALLAGFAFFVWKVNDMGYQSGVIAATRGQATAKLVEKPDGTNEWVVEKVAAPKQEPTP